MEEVFQECVREERRGGRTVLLSSHILSKVEALCDRVTIIRKGRADDLTGGNAAMAENIRRLGGRQNLTVCVLLGQVGPLLNVPQAVLDVSPFTHTPELPGGEFSVLPLATLTVAAAATAAAGLTAFRRRDIG